MKLEKEYTVYVDSAEQELLSEILNEIERIQDEYDNELNGKEMADILIAIANEWDRPNGTFNEMLTIEYV